MHQRLIPVLLTVVLVSACVGSPWRARVLHDHPLVGRIWDVAGSRFVGADVVVERLVASRFVLLGEKHDNPDHHRLQALLVRQMIAAGRRAAVAFEMFSTDQAAAIARQVAEAPRNAAGVADAVDWKRSGWPDWAMYEPIVQAALDAGTPVVAANLPSKTARETSRQGIEALDRDLVTRYGLDRPLPPDAERSMAAEIQDSHCGHAPASLITKMVLVQRARDAQMADALITAGARDGAVLITGDGHARSDRGVPAQLRARMPDARITSVGFLEVSRDLAAPADYAKDMGSDRLVYDYVWFTPRVDTDDPCEKFKRSLERLKQKQ